MAHTTTRTEYRAAARDLYGPKLTSFVAMFAAFRTWRSAVATRKMLRGLTAEQLEDIGHAETPLPSLVVKAGLITNLMSMR